MKAGSRLLYGVGLNDADYVTQEVEISNGSKKYITCPFYRKWASMLNRCYSPKYHRRHPTYKDCSVCDEWLTFSKFKAWMEFQDWQGKELDKDILITGNKVYSPETCVFVDSVVNCFFITGSKSKSGRPAGICLRKRNNKYSAKCSNPITGRAESLGDYATEHAAHEAWKKMKQDIGCQLAELQSDHRVAKALRTRYLTA
jgi:hypothetical protein